MVSQPATAAARFPPGRQVWKCGRMPAISYPVPGGGTYAGYLAVPSATPGPWPAVVVIHEAFGLNDDIREKADEFAGRGYLALAPDLFEGKSWIRCVRGAFRQLQAGSGPAL